MGPDGTRTRPRTDRTQLNNLNTENSPFKAESQGAGVGKNFHSEILDDLNLPPRFWWFQFSPPDPLYPQKQTFGG